MHGLQVEMRCKFCDQEDEAIDHLISERFFSLLQIWFASFHVCHGHHANRVSLTSRLVATFKIPDSVEQTKGFYLTPFLP